MKTLVNQLALFFTTLILIPTALAQGINGRVYHEIYHNTSQNIGININHVSKHGQQVGFFFAKQVEDLRPEQLREGFTENEYFGFFHSFPITHHQRFNLHFQSRFGLINGEKVTYAPALVGSVNLTEKLAFEVGFSNRLSGFNNVIGLRYTFKGYKNMITEGISNNAKVSRYY